MIQIQPKLIILGQYVQSGRIPKSGIIISYRVLIKRLTIDPKLRKNQPGFEIVIEESQDAGKTHKQLDKSHPKYLDLLTEALVGETRQLFGFAPPTHVVLENAEK